MHKPVASNPSFAALEEEILEWWNANEVQKKALKLREGAIEFVFYEGPPTANTTPPLHAAWPRTYKDIFVRYRTMKGFYVPRKAGWDCHGLPVEIEVEKKLGFTNKQQIVDYGIERFNEICRTSVLEYVSAFVAFSERLGFWLDYEDPYHTMDNDYIESVWWSLAQLHGKDLLFEADRITPYCPRCETPLSDHELGQEDVYQDVTDPGVTLALPLVAPPSGLEGAAFAVWTTTPWTLIANLACAVGPEITYALVEHEGKKLILAESLVGPALGIDPTPAPLRTMPGKDLVGLEYRPPFDYAQRAVGDQPEAWKALAADFVNIDEGTGIVHLAGAFGADDLEAVRSAGIQVYNPVDRSGRFDASVPEYKGTFVKDADADIVARLGASGALVRSEPYLHSYPHCWRCNSPLLYYALQSWYVRTTAFKERLLEVNANVNWIPEHIREGRYGDWLRNNVDWSLSRYRFWGTPLPIWRCEQGHDTAVDSRAKLGELAGADQGSLDLHRPHVDAVTFPCPTCGKEARRIPDLIDVWYDSGAMPFAQLGYPRRNEELFEKRFPADFIAEAIDQTRGWFYSLMAEGVMLFDESAYRNVICHGHLVDEFGKKMSKSKESRVEPEEVFEKYGADALRFHILGGGGPSDSRRIGDGPLTQVLRGPFLTLWNVYRLYVLYANIDEFDPNTWELIAPGVRPPLDRWILSELHQLIFEVTDALDSYDAFRGARRIAEFIDDLSNWYVRRSRRRFWRAAETDEEEVDKSAAFWTLWTCLVDLSSLLAPFAPFLSETLYRNLVSEVNPSAPISVHLSDFPGGEPEQVDPRLAAGMAAARELASLGHSARGTAGFKVRQPLGHAVLLVPEDLRDAVEDVAELLAEELNVAEFSFAEDAGEVVRLTLRPNYRSAGPELGPRVRELAKSLEALDSQACAELAAKLDEGADIDIEVTDGENLRISPEHIEIRREPAEGTAFAYEPPFGVSLDLTITTELRREGLAREFVHQVQTVRRDIGLDVTDRITLSVVASDELKEALREHDTYVAEELLATDFEFPESAGEGWRTIEVEGAEVAVSITKA